MSLCILLYHAQVVLNCVDLFIICLNKKINHKHSCFLFQVAFIPHNRLVTCMQTAETWAEFMFASFYPSRAAKTDVICFAA